METKIRGMGRVSGVETDIQASQAAEMLVAQGAAYYGDVTRGGYHFLVRNTTAVAAVAAIPTVGVNMAIYNTAVDGGKSVIVDAVFASQVGNAGAALEGAGIIYNLGQRRATAPTSAGLVIQKLNGVGPSNDSVVVTTVGGTDLEGTYQGIAISWMPIGNNVRTIVVSLPGMSIWAPVNGRIIVPPGRFFALNVLSSSADADFVTGVQWHEKQITLG